jgi:HSP20 family molecular chaperone IbpA
MKKQVFLLHSIIVCLFLSFNLNAQDLKQTLSAIQSKVGEIQIDKITYKQSVEILDDAKGKIRFTSVAVDDKGKAVKESYEFYVADIDKNTVIRKTSGKKLMVSMATNNKQKFIKYLKEDNLESYVDNVEMLVSDADAAQTLMDQVKKAIPLVKSSEKTFATAKDALAWLKSNIGEVSTKTGKSEQSFSFNDQKEYLVALNVKSTDTKGATVEENYEFNVADVNKNAIQLKVSGSVLSVSIENRGSEKYIRYTKNNQLQSYAGDVSVLSGDIDHARQLIAAFTAAVEKTKPVYPSYSSAQQASDFVKGKVADISIDAKTITQKIEFGDGGSKATLVVGESDSKGKVTKHQYEFYLSDVDKSGINFKVSGKKVMVMVSTANKVKLVKCVKDDVPQSYQGDVEILSPDIETARTMVDAFAYAAKTSKAGRPKWNSVTEVVNFLTAAIKGEALGTDKYELSFEADLTEPWEAIYHYKRIDAKGAETEGAFLFYPFMLDTNNIKVESSGKYLAVTAPVKEKKSFVKKLKGELSQGFTSELEIMAFDAKQAKEIALALRYFAGNYTPKAKDWSDKAKAMNFVKETVGNFSNASKEVKQKLELVNNDPCKVTLTINTTDDKGKTLEEIYEFSLSDMNKLMVDYKISSNNVYVTMVCKNKEKFVKVYKNGAQQSYASEVRIVEDDVERARNIADALRAAVIQCEK